MTACNYYPTTQQLSQIHYECKCCQHVYVNMYILLRTPCGAALCIYYTSHGRMRITCFYGLSIFFTTAIFFKKMI